MCFAFLVVRTIAEPRCNCLRVPKNARRMVQATCRRFEASCRKRGLKLHEHCFAAEYETNIPRQAGLSGSSAIVCATLNCLLTVRRYSGINRVDACPSHVLSSSGSGRPSPLNLTDSGSDELGGHCGWAVSREWSEGCK